MYCKIWFYDNDEPFSILIFSTSTFHIWSEKTKLMKNINIKHSHKGEGNVCLQTI